MADSDKILLIGHDPLTLAQIQATVQHDLRWKNHTIDSLHSLEKALNELSIMDYKIVVCDCSSFNESPFEILTQLRTLKKNIPLILINNPGMEKIAIHCLKHGADYYMIKTDNWQKEIPQTFKMVCEEKLQKEKEKTRFLQLAQENKQLKEASPLDNQTNFYLPTHFQSVISKELKRAVRHHFELSCLVMEVHSNMNPARKLLQPLTPVYEQLAIYLKSVARSSDIWGRIDENHFAALLPHTTIRQARQTLKRINS